MIVHNSSVPLCPLRLCFRSSSGAPRGGAERSRRRGGCVEDASWLSWAACAPPRGVRAGGGGSSPPRGGEEGGAGGACASGSWLTTCSRARRRDGPASQSPIPGAAAMGRARLAAPRGPSPARLGDGRPMPPEPSASHPPPALCVRTSTRFMAQREGVLRDLLFAAVPAHARAPVLARPRRHARDVNDCKGSAPIRAAWRP